MTLRIWVSAFAAALLACCTLSAQQPPPDSSDTDALSRRAAERLRTLHEEAQRLASQEKSVLGELRKLEVDRQIKAEELKQAETDAARVAVELKALDAQIATLDEAARKAIPDLEARLVSLYKLGGGRYLRLLLSTSDIRQFGQASRLVVELADQDRMRLTAQQRRLHDLNESRTTVTDRQAKLAALRRQVQLARAETERLVAARNALIQEIDQRRDLNAALSGELLMAQQNLQSAVTGLSTGPAPSLPIRPFRGDLDWPLAGIVRQRFGTADARRGANNGIDIAAAEGVPVHAVHTGTVAFADVFTGFGRLVILDHGGQNFSLYGNLKDISVAKGDRLQGGGTLGSVGVAPTGAAGLYFELRIDGRAVDPLQWLKKR